MSETVLGVNFGSSFSSIAVITRDGQAEVIADEDGHRQIHNAVSFVDDQEYIGVQGRKQLVRNNVNTILRFRDLLGKTYDQVKSSYTPGALQAAPLSNQDGQPAFQVVINGQTQSLTAQQVTTKFLQALYNSATDFLGTKPTAAIFAVPLDFTEKQAEALKEASKAAGVEIKQLIPEVAAASVVYGLTSSPRDTSFSIGDRNILFVDVGAVSTEATVLAVRSGLLSTLASVKETVGGDDLDTKLVEFLSKEFTKKTKVTWDPKNHRSMAKLYLEVESTKRTLSASTTATCAVESLAEGMDFSNTINRTRFDLLARTVYDRICAKALEAVSQAGLDPVQIHEIVLLGATNKLPSLQNKIRDLFPDHTRLTLSIDSDEAVAKGCALQGDLLLNVPSSVPVDIAQAEKIAHNVPALSAPLGLLLGSDKEKDKFALLLDANTPLPARKIIELSVGTSTSAKQVLLSLWQGKHSVHVEKPVVEKKAAADSDSESEDEPEEIRTAVLKADTPIADLALDVSTEIQGKGRSAEPAKVRVVLVVGKDGKGYLEAKQGQDGEAARIAF